MIFELKRYSNNNIKLLDNLNIPNVLKRIYIHRGISSVQELDKNLNNLLDYKKLSGIDQAVKLLINAINKRLKIIVVGDFDVDGATSVALTILSFKQFGVNTVDFLVPNRFKDGYGLTKRLVKKALDKRAEIIITVDNGISSHEGISFAIENKILVIVTDHHKPSNVLPPATIIINPNLPTCLFNSKYLAGVGVVFYLMLALRAKLNKYDWFKKNGQKYPKLINFLDLVALGTIADLVPLDTNNRILVYHGLNRIKLGLCRPGIKALIDISNLDIKKICADDLSFSLGPRINAAGRLKDISLGIKLLLSDNIKEAKEIALKLNELNKIRRKIENNMQLEATNICKQINDNYNIIPLCVIIYNNTWHQGIIGILASRIKEKFYRPAIVFAPSKNGEIKGSGRSINGLNIISILEKLNIFYPDLMLSFGGHSMAVGINLKLEKFNKFKKYFLSILKNSIHPEYLKNIIWSDGSLKDNELSIYTAELIKNNGPWGQGFPNPIFDGKFCLLKQKLVSDRHLKVLLKPIDSNLLLDGIIFNIDINTWPNNNINFVEIAYKLDTYNFKGNIKLQLLIQYIWPL